MHTDQSSAALEPKNNLPSSFDLYAEHVLNGRSLRSLARETGLSPSTVLRRVRKIEDRRDDPLIDDFFGNLAPLDPLPSFKSTGSYDYDNFENSKPLAATSEPTKGRA